MPHVPAGSGRRWLPRRRAGVAVLALAALGLVPGFLFLAPASRWDAPLLVVALGALAVIAYHSRVPLPPGVQFDGSLALMLIAVALLGPLPALLAVGMLPWAINAVTGREPRLRTGALADLASYGWQAIAAVLVLEAAGVRDPISPGAVGWLMAAGGVLYTVGWMASATHAPLCLGHPFRALARAYVDMLPAGGAMIALAAAATLTRPLGVLALALFAVIAILPQTFLTYAAQSRPVARLDQATATRRYAHAVAVQLGLPRRERRHLAVVLSAAQRHPPTGDALDYVCAMLADPSQASYEAQTIAEWWNGGGAPLRLRGEEIPLAARVVAVAQTWAALTASGTPELAHDDALVHLHSVAGARLDPAVVDAARAVIGQEIVTTDQPAPEPRLHHLRLPTPLRRALTASVE